MCLRFVVVGGHSKVVQAHLVTLLSLIITLLTPTILPTVDDVLLAAVDVALIDRWFCGVLVAWKGFAPVNPFIREEKN
jgi:hypothetical protein